jgi:hypothetical protein
LTNPNGDLDNSNNWSQAPVHVLATRAIIDSLNNTPQHLEWGAGAAVVTGGLSDVANRIAAKSKGDGEDEHGNPVEAKAEQGTGKSIIIEAAKEYISQLRGGTDKAFDPLYNLKLRNRGLHDRILEIIRQKNPELAVAYEKYAKTRDSNQAASAQSV